MRHNSASRSVDEAANPGTEFLITIHRGRHDMYGLECIFG